LGGDRREQPHFPFLVGQTQQAHVSAAARLVEYLSHCAVSPPTSRFIEARIEAVVAQGVAWYADSISEHQMKYRILMTAAAIALSSFAMASLAKQDSHDASAANVTSAAQLSDRATRLAMGPTSAPQKPGGSGQEPMQTPKPHKKAKHKHNAA
jgi:hypothetical protein